MNVKMYENQMKDATEDVTSSTEPEDYVTGSTLDEHIDDVQMIFYESAREITGEADPGEVTVESTGDNGLVCRIYPSLDPDALDMIADDIRENLDVSVTTDVVYEQDNRDYAIYVRDDQYDIQASEDITAGTYDVPELPLDPPEDRNYHEVDNFRSCLEGDVRIPVVIQEGYYPQIEDMTDFADQLGVVLHDEESRWEKEFQDLSQPVEDLEFLMERYECPNAPGRYIMKGHVKMVYDVSGLTYTTHPEYYGEDEGWSDNKEFDSDVDIDFNVKRSSIEDIEYELVTEAATNITASSVIYNDDAKVCVTKNYDTFQTATYQGRNYALHYVEVDSSPEADENEMYDEFAAQITLIAPYDDADYVWAKIENGFITYIHKQKAIAHEVYLTAFDMGYENPDWISAVCDIAIERLARYNEKIQPKMVHN